MNDSTQLISQDVEETIKEIKDQFSRRGANRRPSSPLFMPV
ncbi:hypothetical protein [Bacillus weihaiensis]|nr:hypothetical protein [Bacillus weihaiensis]